MEPPLWTSGETKDVKQERRLKAKMARSNYRIRYDLAFEGGGSDFNEYYLTKFGARFSAFFWLNFRSWGGSAELYPHPAKIEIPTPENTPRLRRYKR